MAHESYSDFDSHGKRISAPSEASIAEESRESDFVPGSSSASSPRSSTHSPVNSGALRSRSTSSTSDGRDLETPVEENTSDTQRMRSTSAASGRGDKEKRKRSRVTPEQLVHLERFFSVDRSPTAARRKEISDLLGMQERQTQIWFQNRRAKAKLQDGKKGRGGGTDTPPDTPPELSTGYEADLHSLIHEDEPITIIHCTDLSIGMWRRIATSIGKHDLVAYVCEVKRCITWFIQSEGYGFKMEIPFETILDTEFTNAAPGAGLATFVLSQPPIFYLENVPSPRDGQQIARQWKRCADWTEGQQATKVLRHELIGSAVQLAHVLRNLHAYTSGSDIRLHSLSYHPPEDRSTAPMEVPQPPLSGLSGPGYHYRDAGLLEGSTPDHLGHLRKRSQSGPSMMPGHRPQHDSDFPSLHVDARINHISGPSSAPYSSSFVNLSGRSSHHSTSAQPQLFSDMSGHSANQIHSSHPQQSYNYSSAPISHAPSSRAYPTVTVSRSLYGEEVPMISPYHHMNANPSSSAGLSHQTFQPPSPPLLTTPYHPPQASSHHISEPVNPSIVSGLPGMSYDSDDDPRPPPEM